MTSTLTKVKPHLQSLFGRAGIYERAKVSWIYDLYWRLSDRTIIDDRQREIDFYRNTLHGFRKGNLIFDIGANNGYKADIFLKLGANVVAVEPDKKGQEILKQKFLRFRLKRKPLSIVGKAISDRTSIEKMWVDAPGSAKNTLNPKWAETLRRDDKRFGQTLNFNSCCTVETMSMEQLIALYGNPFFVKIDVEGHELAVLRGMRRPVPYLSFEVNLPEFKPEGLECVRILDSLDSRGEFNYVVDCRSGLVLKNWSRAEQFSSLLSSCTHESIEVFWRSQSSDKQSETQSPRSADAGHFQSSRRD